ncbi:hypothetical protein LTR27_008264 [Elasticomyces elasticus]|nr:hypothetical protein LTR27_008264 [Elasticomyces elasticus]
MNRGFHGPAGPAPFGPPVQTYQQDPGDIWAGGYNMGPEFRESVAATAASLGILVAGSQPGYVNDPYYDKVWTLIAREQRRKISERIIGDQYELADRMASFHLKVDDSRWLAPGSDKTSAGTGPRPAVQGHGTSPRPPQPGFYQAREISAAPVETFAAPAVHEIVLPPESPECQEVDDVVREPPAVQGHETSPRPQRLGFYQMRELSDASVETSAGPAVPQGAVHEIKTPVETPDGEEVKIVFDEPASAAAPEVPAVLPVRRENPWAVTALDSAAVRSLSTFRTQSNLLRTNISAPEYDALLPRPTHPTTLPRATLPRQPQPRVILPPTQLPLQPQPHVDRLVLRDQIRRQRAVQSTSILPRPQPRDNRPHLRVQTRFEQHEPATFDNPSSGEYTSDEDFLPRSARRHIKEQRLLRKAERLKEAETLTSPPATTEQASVAASQDRLPTAWQWKRRAPANPIRITSAKTGKEVDLARRRAESPTPTRARRSSSASASESDLESPMTIRPTLAYMHAARELFLEETYRNVDALGEEH